jgi:hypothetical protein
MRSLGSVQFTSRDESQIEWVDRLDWQPIGQTIRYALAGNPVVMENARSGRPITLTVELPWGWLSATTVNSLVTLAETSQSLAFVYDSFSCTVRFRRDSGPLQLVPVDPRRLYYTGSIYLIQVD